MLRIVIKKQTDALPFMTYLGHVYDGRKWVGDVYGETTEQVVRESLYHYRRTDQPYTVSHKE